MTGVIVRVQLINNDGDIAYHDGQGETIEDAVWDAEQACCMLRGDNSYVMNEWWPA